MKATNFMRKIMILRTFIEIESALENSTQLVYEKEIGLMQRQL